MVQASRRTSGLATLAALLLGGPVLAQEVQIFEEPPPLELLRSIMVPESRPGPGRRFFVPHGSAQPAPLAREPAAVAPERLPAKPEPSSGRARRLAAPDLQRATACSISSLAAAAPAVTPDLPSSIAVRVNFATDSDAVPPSAFSFLDRIGELMRDQPELKLEVAGHTDAVGSDIYNLLLSQRRAAAVARHLVQRQGVPMTRLVVLGLGKNAPLFENGYAPRNRRVQFARVE